MTAPSTRTTPQGTMAMPIPPRAARLPLLLAAALAACDTPTGSADPAELRITAPSAYVEVGQSLVLSAAATDASSRPVEGARVRWTSRSPAVAEVRDGLVTGRAAGKAVVVAAAGGAADSLVVTVEATTHGITIWPDTVFVLPGRAMRLGVEVRDGSGQPVSQRLHFASSAPGVATVQDGEVRGVAAGEASVTVTAGLRSASVPVRVVTGARLALAELTAPPGWRVFATGVNARGEVMGALSPLAGEVRALLWRRGRLLDLGVPPGFTSSTPTALSDAGVVVGYARSGVGASAHTMAWSWSGGAFRLLDVGPGQARPTGVNSRGDVVGNRVATGPTGVPTSTAFLYRDGQTVSLTLEGATGVNAVSVNASGAVAVAFDRGLGGTGSAVWRDGAFTILPLPEDGTPRAINDRGEVIGRMAYQVGRAGWMWDGEKATVLAGLASVSALNNHGDILATNMGDSRYPNLLMRGGQWLQLQQMIPAGWQLMDVMSINDAGWIVAHARHVASGRDMPVLLTPRD